MGLETRTVIDRMTFGEVLPLARKAVRMMRALGGVSHSDSLCRGGDAMQDLRGKNVTPLSQEVSSTPAPARPLALALESHNCEKRHDRHHQNLDHPY